jgi:quinol monooxygenase YgiN
LAIADVWISAKDIENKKSLLDVLKLLAVDLYQTKTLSGKVRVLAERGLSRGAEFHPNAGEGNSFQEWINKLVDWANDFKDTTASLKVLEVMNDWSQSSKLTGVRTKLGIHPDNEKPVEIIVLTKSQEEMLEELGCTSYYLKDSRTDSVYLVFNTDHEQYDSIEHEYAHSQSEGLDSWYGSFIFRGLNEP